ERGHPEAAASAQFERPSRQQLVELLIDVRVFDEIAGGIDFQNRLDDRRFAARELRVGVLVGLKSLLRVRSTKKLQEAFVVSVFSSSFQLTSLCESVRKDLRFQGIPRRVLDEGVARLELPIFRHVTNAENDRSPIRSDLKPPVFGAEEIQEAGRAIVFGLHA